MKNTFLLALLLLAAMYASAQTGVYIAAGADVAAYKKDTVSIFSDVENNGNIGSFKGAVVNFYGKKWKNGSTATFPDQHDYIDTLSPNGGVFRFLQLGKNNQYLEGGYSIGWNRGATFPNLSLENINGLTLQAGDLKIRDTLNFSAGNIFLNSQNLVVGNGYPGVITGYSNQRFVVTGQSKIVGMLLREHITKGDGLVVYPIGTSAASYTPLALQNHDNIADDFFAGVFDNIYEKATYGSILNKPQVRKTWNLIKRNNTKSNISLWLQHNDQEQDAHFKFNRDSSYISYYTNNAWDSTFPTGIVNPGTLTSGPAISNGYMSFRSFFGDLSSNNFFSVVTPKSVRDRSSNVGISFNAWRTDIRWVKADWFTYWEINMKQFELQRRRIDEDSFHTVAILPAKTADGSTILQQEYTTNDDNLYDNWTYYRVKGIGNDGMIYFSRVELVPNFIEIKPYPNPSNGSFSIYVWGVKKPMKLSIVSSVGQVVHTQTLNGSGTVNRKDLASGIYFLLFYDATNGSLLYKHKIEIIR